MLCLRSEKCQSCKKDKPLGEMHGRNCWECYEILHPRANHSKRELEDDEEMKIDYYLTPERPSAADFVQAHSPAASSSAASSPATSHGKVCNAHICPHQTLLLLTLHALAMLAIVFAMVPMGANAGAMPPSRLQKENPPPAAWATWLLLGTHRRQVFDPIIFISSILLRSQDCPHRDCA